MGVGLGLGPYPYPYPYLYPVPSRQVLVEQAIVETITPDKVRVRVRPL